MVSAMAFLNKIGNLVKNSAVKHINQDFSVSTPSLFQAIRSMSSAKLFVGGISYSTDDMSLRESFARYGEVIDVKVIMDRETGRSRGFGFITFATSEDASYAIQGMDGQDLHGRRIRVNYATERSRPGFGGDGGYRGSGGSDGYNRGGNYGSGNYNVTSSYSDGNAETSYTSGANAGNYQFNENSGGVFGSASGEFSSNQNDATGADNDEFIEPLEDNVRENNDEPTDYAQNR
ncbi:glycine-rich RNA-binding protein 4, mitochondrial-like isoform X1 [Glycine soja]|uniref:Glycine-rich RNA-binding protein 3, mitochondrial isoform B n=2 Tax=Glycine soja TaxID=3848 RepID=A0A445JJH7_GLYSO|nr:glycine-rich RNA-binding protein 4, mitochondrial-like isoform X1 [Glycine soja]RZB98634.1 Glycine-rich RNA-binding protein 3, mitochondrial isoform B [Glycine soja]RZB98635.1 Glycine-rich RNA-binding protein 3, mitochondrial isoform C [Glycine soja]RZB98636.1 Glycine-rich RNA-binding protein 3, mitochondrial isoform D [Glycine soja]